ncbi:MAG: hypothetical protein L3J20_01825 [Flavobacteriaceae bacterium]|nr:hypothetical protein [Flavobacteriaceae bacterium]
MEEEDTRSFNVELKMYRGHKIDVGENSGVEIHFNDKKAKLYCLRYFVSNQKTLSSTKSTYARLEIFYEIDDFDKDIIASLKFYLKDHIPI